MKVPFEGRIAVALATATIAALGSVICASANAMTGSELRDKCIAGERFLSGQTTEPEAAAAAIACSAYFIGVDQTAAFFAAGALAAGAPRDIRPFCVPPTSSVTPRQRAAIFVRYATANPV